MRPFITHADRSHTENAERLSLTGAKGEKGLTKNFKGATESGMSLLRTQRHGMTKADR